MSEIKTTDERLSEIELSVKEIRDALVGDEYQDGFRQRIEKIELDIPIFKRAAWIAIGGIGALSVLATLFSILKNIL